MNTLPYNLFVSTPTGNQVYSSRACLNCVLQLENRRTTVELIFIPMHDIEFIGMDWLSLNNALLDYALKTISLPMQSMTLDNRTESIFLNATQVVKCLKSDCQGYLLLLSAKFELEEGIEKSQ